MKTLMRALRLLSAVIIFVSPAFGADPSSFPSNGIDTQSLGRGGAVIACPPGVWSVFGNPATLTPAGFSALGLDYINQRDVSESSWSLSVVDTSSSIRGALSYLKDPEFAGFKNKMWGVSFSQTLMPSLFVGESFHMGDYDPSTPGSEKSTNTVDAGLLYKVGPKVSIGYVSHNLFPDDRDLLEQYDGFGIGMQLPWTIYFAADYEEDPVLNGENNLRVGVEFNPVKKITGRLGYQDLAEANTTRISLGITYRDINGTLDGAILYNDQTNKTDRIALGFSIRM